MGSRTPFAGGGGPPTVDDLEQGFSALIRSLLSQKGPRLDYEYVQSTANALAGTRSISRVEGPRGAGARYI